MKRLFFALIAGFSVIFIPFSASAISGLPEGFSVETVTENLTAATAIAFAPDGRIFIAEKNGVVRIANADGSLISAPALDLSAQTSAGYTDRGMIGIAVDPDFADNGYFYVAYTYENDPSNPDGKKTARVSRFTASGNTADIGTEFILVGSVAGTPEKPSCADYPSGSDCIASDAWSHTVGGLRFGPDDKLYVATGDGSGFSFSDPHAFRSQDLDHLSGKILRINTDGTGVSDNPFYTENADDNRSKIYAYGFRNPYRFNFRPGTDDLYVADVGWGEKEELDFLIPGKNYGWPCREGSIENFGYSGFDGCPITTELEEGIYEYDHEETENGKIGSITGGAFATSDTYPDYFKDTYVFGDYSFDFMKYITFDGQTEIESVDDFAQEVDIPVEFVTGPDGLVYMLTFSYNTFVSELRRIVYSEGPQAVIEASVTAGEIPLTVEFDGGSSSAPGDAAITYVWDFGDGHAASGEEVVHVYNGVGIYTAELTVTSDGQEATATRTITVTEPYDGGYDVEPYHISTDVLTPLPYYFGTPVEIATRIGNRSGGDTFSLTFEIRSPDGTHLSQYDQTFPEEVIVAGAEKTYAVNFFLPIGTYTVNTLLTSPDGAQTYEWSAEVAALNIVTRSPGANPQGGDNALYRFWSENYRGHFYTTSLAEKQELEENNPNWLYEGIAYDVVSEGATDAVPVYRFWSENYQGHFYTRSEVEKEKVLEDDNWALEGVAYYVFATDASDRSPVYRFWSDNYKHHFYTDSLAERDLIMEKDPNWAYEGVGWYIEA